ncbi:unnamed protein product [Haemonchus placei]|uniref:Alpha-1,3-mannosyl-glycoprotein 2-beta-N-acetylglucosaminyltransferase n=1 Tax=Haemonchus placei TaxID=6290 RepID=A0A0N4WFQ0_HAEPC|nr:unnamed protein product [Haemonchus placei]
MRFLPKVHKWNSSRARPKVMPLSALVIVICMFKHKSAQEAHVVVPKNHHRFATYYYIARHYKLALEHVFDTLGHNSAILLEDDLDIAVDFFEYFLATRYLLDEDPTLFCVSAWNDNGKVENIDAQASSLLYRTDFFPGLGWMMTSQLWKEIQPKWPNGFWDDWLREPENRKGRQCIRPEISRTGMTPSGKKGASKGLFFDKHLAKVVLNVANVPFTTMNLDYLLNVCHDFSEFFHRCLLAPIFSAGLLPMTIRVVKERLMERFLS